MIENLTPNNLCKLLHGASSLIQSNLDKDEVLEEFTFILQEMLNSDGATLYLARDGQLMFHNLSNKNMDVRWRANSEEIRKIAPLILNVESKNPVSIECFLRKKTIIVDDIYSETSFNTEASRQFDQQFNYKTKSLLAVPILGSLGEVIGVLQFINARSLSNDLIQFDPECVKLAESFSGFIGSILQRSN